MRASTRQLMNIHSVLADGLSGISFGAPVSHVYNPLSYAWAPVCQYLALADIDASKEGGQMILRVRQDADPDTAGIRGGLFGARH